MRKELTDVGVQELRTSADVDAFFSEKEGTALVVVNSVCGCAAGSARPGVRLALRHPSKPDRVATVFAGMDLDAVERARAHFGAVPPSSPSLALFKGGELVAFVPRQKIEGRNAETVAADLVTLFEEHCRTAPGAA
jgi:putative YphP/YqiW family bacilliredoxin